MSISNNPADYTTCLSAAPYYVSCIKLWTPPHTRLAGASEPVRQAANHLPHLLEDGAIDDAKKLYAAGEPLLRQTGLGDLADALRALIAVYERNFVEAERLAAQAVTAQPDCTEYHYLCGVIAAQKRDIANCVAHCEHALKINPELGLAAMALAIIHTLNRDWQKGLTFARSAEKHKKEFNPFLVELCLLACAWRLGLPNESPLDFSALNEPGDAKAELEWLPKVEWPSISPAPLTLFVYCDHAYLLEHAAPLVWSLAETGARDVLIHLHVANPAPATAHVIEELRKRSRLSITYSFEQIDPVKAGNFRVYHSSARFCRFLQFLQHANSPVLMIDADTLFRRPLHELSMLFEPSTEIGVQHNANGVFWETVCGNGIFARPVPAAFDYLAMVDSFIIRNLQQGRGRWFIDQIALGLSFEKLGKQMKFTELPFERMADLAHGDNSVMWAVTLEKNNDDRYNAFKRELLGKYGDVKNIK